MLFRSRAKAQNPAKAWSEITKGDWPATKAYYRFIDQPDGSPATLSGILQPHRERTIQRLQAQRTVLCIQDGTDLNYTNLDQCEGLHSLGSNQTGAQSRGLHLHSTLAVTTAGLPLGVLRADCPQPHPKPPKVRSRNGTLTAPRSYQVPIEQKKMWRAAWKWAKMVGVSGPGGRGCRPVSAPGADRVAATLPWPLWLEAPEGTGAA